MYIFITMYKLCISLYIYIYKFQKPDLTSLLHIKFDRTASPFT